MADFSSDQKAYISKTIKLAITEMELKVGTILGQAEAMQTEIKRIVEKHETELHASANRVTTLVDQANAAQGKLEGATAKIDDADVKIKNAEQIVTDLMEKLRLFEANFEDHGTQLVNLNSDTETAAPTTWHPPALRRAGDSFSRA